MDSRKRLAGSEYSQEAVLKGKEAISQYVELLTECEVLDSELQKLNRLTAAKIESGELSEAISLEDKQVTLTAELQRSYGQFESQHRGLLSQMTSHQRLEMAQYQKHKAFLSGDGAQVNDEREKASITAKVGMFAQKSDEPSSKPEAKVEEPQAGWKCSIQ